MHLKIEEKSMNVQFDETKTSKFVAVNATSPNAHTAEEMHVILTERICRAEAGQEEIIPNQVVFDSIHTKYGF